MLDIWKVIISTKTGCKCRASTSNLQNPPRPTLEQSPLRKPHPASPQTGTVARPARPGAPRVRPPQRAPLRAGAWHVSVILFASNAMRARSRSPARFLRSGSGAGLREPTRRLPTSYRPVSKSPHVSPGLTRANSLPTPGHFCTGPAWPRGAASPPTSAGTRGLPRSAASPPPRAQHRETLRRTQEHNGRFCLTAAADIPGTLPA